MPKQELKERAAPLAVSYDDLRPGDILLFMPSKETCNIQYVIMTLQLFCFRYTESGGHFDTTHAGIFIKHNNKGDPIIAHIAPEGYVQQTIQEYDSDERAFMVYRLQDQSMREKLATIAMQESNQKLKWKLLAALRALVRLPRLDPERPPSPIEHKELSEDTFCSKFVMECLKEAARTSKIRENARSTISPKSLESYLYYHESFDRFVYLGKSPLQAIQSEIENDLMWLNKPAVTNAYLNIMGRIEQEMGNRNEMFKIIALLEVMEPLLKSHKAGKKLAELIRKRGIFAKDVYQHPVDVLLNNSIVPKTPSPKMTR